MGFVKNLALQRKELARRIPGTLLRCGSLEAYRYM